MRGKHWRKTTLIPRSKKIIIIIIIITFGVILIDNSNI
jgi:hypothetical protein